MTEMPSEYNPDYVIVETPGREQPFTVWREGEVLRFEATRAKAEAYVRLVHVVGLRRAHV